MSSTPHIPTMVKPDAFTIGKDIGITPGSVVARTDVYELIQYKPSTPTVHEYPLLMVPPMINKYYITDLTPGRSMLEFFVAQGYQVFVFSWRNPGREARDWGMNTYGEAIVDAMGMAREITKSPKVNVIGLCAGGIMTSMVCSHLSATGRLDEISSPVPGRDAAGHDAGGHDRLADGREHGRPRRSSPPASAATWTGARSRRFSPGSGPMT